jgi:2-dehydro-3-deoxyphosphogluconate aldolase / (4S)-4-hydroxy-2-oxoglutarate aldolase
MKNSITTLIEKARAVSVIPVMVIERPEDAVPLAQALADGGLTMLEITLRSDAALGAIRDIKKHVSGVDVGAGTVLDTTQWRAAEDAGATFMVSPGLTESLARTAAESSVPLLPGVATSSEIMIAREHGFRFLKFFPAEQAGGVNMLSAFGGPFADTLFCPTGGVSPSNAASYLKLANVVCVGGSWVAPKAMVAAKDWAGITVLAKGVAALRK